MGNKCGLRKRETGDDAESVMGLSFRTETTNNERT